MAYTYCVRKNIVQDEEKKAYTVYGIEAVGSGGEILSSFSDVFFDRQRAERFADFVTPAVYRWFIFRMPSRTLCWNRGHIKV